MGYIDMKIEAYVGIYVEGSLAWIFDYNRFGFDIHIRIYYSGDWSGVRWIEVFWQPDFDFVVFDWSLL